MQLVIAALLCISFFFSGNSHASLLISEYIEGSSNNKALEFFNNGNEIDFGIDVYSVEIYSNGSLNPSRTISLTGNVAPLGVYVLAHIRAEPEIVSNASQTSSALSFNGDDAIVLMHNGMIVDSIGQIGVDPGVEWGSGETSTQDNTLVRNEMVLTGDVDAYDVFDPAAQWTGYSQDTFQYLGAHRLSSSAAPVIVEPEIVDVPTLGTLFLFVLGLLLLILYNKFNSPLRSCSAVAH